MLWHTPTAPRIAGPVVPSGFIEKAAKPTATALSVAPAGQTTHWANRFWLKARLNAATSINTKRLFFLHIPRSFLSVCCFPIVLDSHILSPFTFALVFFICLFLLVWLQCRTIA